MYYYVNTSLIWLIYNLFFQWKIRKKTVGQFKMTTLNGQLKPKTLHTFPSIYLTKFDRGIRN